MKLSKLLYNNLPATTGVANPAGVHGYIFAPQAHTQVETWDVGDYHVACFPSMAYTVFNSMPVSWGRNLEGQLGVGDATNRSTPTLMVNAQFTSSYVTNAVHTFCGPNNTYWHGISTGSIVCAGAGTVYNPNMQSGTTFGNLSSPTFSVFNTIQPVFHKHETGYTLPYLANAQSWGRNDSGQMGTGTTTTATTLTTISSNRAYNRIWPMPYAAYAEAPTLNVIDRGYIFCWGLNTNGQLGVGDTVNRSSPVQFSTGGIWKKFVGTTVYGTSFGLKNDGTVWVWGQGGVPVNPGASSSTPVQIAGLSGIIDIEARGEDVVARQASGNLYGWGLNSAGQLGTGNTSAVSTPTLIASPANGILSMRCGLKNVYYLDGSGQIYAAGDNTYGQLGTGTSTASLAFIAATQKVSVNGTLFPFRVGHRYTFPTPLLPSTENSAGVSYFQLQSQAVHYWTANSFYSNGGWRLYFGD